MSERTRNSKTIDWSKQPLGEMPDTELARQLQKKGHDDMTAARVRHHRQRLGINAYVDPREGIDRSTWADAGLGVKPDAEIARERGVSRQRVHQVRERYGIPAPGTEPKPKAKSKAKRRKAKAKKKSTKPS